MRRDTAANIRVLLVMPDGRIRKLKAGPFQMSFREAPVTLTTLAALIPEELGIEVRCVDESVQRVPRDEHFDIVGISCMTGTAPRAYEIAAHFKEKGALIALGGIHVTLRPEEARGHADVIFTGFTEETWPRFLTDYARGVHEQSYSSTGDTFPDLPSPKRELQKRRRYMVPNTIAATRGCKGSCEFCSVPAASYGWSKRPVSSVIDEIRGIRARRIVFSDVHLTQEPDHAKELLRAMIPLKKRWGGLASTRIVDDPELLDLMAESGCSYLLIGFESISNSSLRGINKGFNRSQDYHNLVDALHDRGIVIQGCFIFGFENDERETFAETVETINELGIDIPRFAVFTPYPGTAAFQRLESQNRLLHQNWYYYDTQHVVFVPNQMSAEELDRGFKWAFRQATGVRSNLTRTVKSGRNAAITFAGGVAYRLYSNQLRRDTNRFPAETGEEIGMTWPELQARRGLAEVNA